MKSSAGRSLLRVPLERLKRRDPLRHWSASVEVKDLRDLGDAAEGESLQVNDVMLAGDGQVDIDVQLTTVAEGVMVMGRIASRWQGPCSRCLRGVGGPIEVSVEELFEPRPVEGETYLLGDELLDLTDLVRDALLLDLPMLAACPEPEPCPYAPAELVEADEADEAATEPVPVVPVQDPRWAALDALRFDD